MNESVAWSPEKLKMPRFLADVPHGCPPLWMRHITPWWVLKWIDNRFLVCWAGVAMWKLGYDGWSWFPTRACFTSYPDSWDYCNKFNMIEPDQFPEKSHAQNT